MKNRLFVVPALLVFFLASGAAWCQDQGHAEKSMWLPERASSDNVPVRIDYLFNLILWITGVTMVGVFVVLGYFLWKYREVPGKKAKYSHGNHTVEMVWTIVPALILIWLAFTQVGDWKSAKVPSAFPKPSESTVVQVAAQQFDWNFRHPGLDGRFETYDATKANADLEKAKTDAASDPEALSDFNPVANRYFSRDDDDDIVDKTLVVPINKPVLIELRSIDVIHSFFIPVYRLKQDAVPGKPMPVWFMPTKLSEGDGWEIACAELCGNNHTTMRARIKVVTQAEFDAYVKDRSGKKEGTIDRSDGADNVWMHWFRQGMRPFVGGELTKPWNDIKIAKQQALLKSGQAAEQK
jgi:cytochrome c oxidase subunit II